MSKQHFEGPETDEKNPVGATALSRRTLLRVAGQAAASSVLVACEGKDMSSGSDLASARDMRGPAVDMRPPDMRPLPDLTPPPDMTYICTPLVATGAETLAVDNAKSFPNTAYPAKSFFVARDAKGFFALRNVCSHQGCQVGYNGAAKTYDCPCHGSRYNLDGTVLNGPTTEPLKSYPLTKLGDGTLEVDPCGSGSTDLSGRVT